MGRRTVDFTCNICGARMADFPVDRLDREVMSCTDCGSNVRWRSIVYLISLALFGRPVTLPEFPVDKSIRAIGLSDFYLYADRLAGKLGFTNTHFHQEPHFDIMAPGAEHLNAYDFMTSSDVFEHVGHPVSDAFKNALAVLKPGGTLIMSVPYAPSGQTIEHFADAQEVRVVSFGDEFVAVKRDAERRYSLQTEGLIFHGGQGDTLEMRVFSKPSLLEELRKAGFTQIRIMEEPYLPFGISNIHGFSLPITARRPKS